MLRSLFVDFNSYFASVEQQLNPALRGRPVGVVPVMAGLSIKKRTLRAMSAGVDERCSGVRV